MGPPADSTFPFPPVPLSSSRDTTARRRRIAARVYDQQPVIANLNPKAECRTKEPVWPEAVQDAPDTGAIAIACKMVWHRLLPAERF